MLTSEHHGLITGQLNANRLARVDAQRDIISRIHRFRRQAIAHYHVGADTPHMEYQKGLFLLKELEEVFNEIHHAWKPGEPWAFQPVESPSLQTARMKEDINRFWDGLHPFPNYHLK